jgi:pyridoxal/pyridoxine/pyridoxamine kinase
MTKIVCVHSLTAHGVVGLKAFITVLGESLVAVPSLLLTGPGNMPGCRRLDYDFAGMLDGALAAVAACGETAWVFVGYLAGEAQVGIVAQALERHADAVEGLVVDPICGDNGRAYVAPGLIAAWPQLLARADWALPNFTELELLTGQCGDEAVGALRARHPRLGLVVTSWPAAGGVGTRLYGAAGASAEHVQPRVAGGGNGTGDLFAAVWLHEVLQLGARPEIAVGTAAAAVVRALQMGGARGSGELALGGLG